MIFTAYHLNPAVFAASTRLSRLTVLIAVSFAAPQLQAASVLDQQHVFSNSGFGSNGGGVAAQTFTVGITGTLDRVEAPLRPSLPGILPGGKLIVEMRLLRVAAGVPGATPADVLAFAAIEIPNPSHEIFPTTFASNFRWVALDGIDLPVVAGEQYAIAVGPLTNPSATFDSSRAFDWTATFDSSLPFEYTGGVHWGFDAQTPTFKPYGGPIRDFIFRTYVSPIPEPTSMALGASACLLATAATLCRRLRSND